MLRNLRGTGRLPSTDLFFLHACGHRVGNRWQRAPITAVGANCFTHGQAMLLVRADSPAVMRAALEWRGRLAYVVDDDIPGAAQSPGLPDQYRRRLAEFNAEYHRLLIQRADVLLVASDVLASRLPLHPDMRRIDPCWTLPLADQRHFSVLDKGGELRIVHLGTGSHGGGLAAIAPTVMALIERDSSLSFTYVAAEPIIPALERHPRAHRLQPRKWPSYRRWLTHARFHLALYPLTAEPFDRARSCNKLIEHALVGAVGTYPRDWLPARLVGDGALLGPSDPWCWAEMIGEVAANRSQLARMAARAGVALSRLDMLAMQRATWSQFFDIEFS